MLIRDTSFVSNVAVEHAVILFTRGFDRSTVMYVINKAYKYPLGTMESYFGKLGAKAKRMKREAELAKTPSFI